MASGDDVSEVVALASISQAAVANASEVVVLASLEQPALAQASNVFMLISYTSPQPPPWTLTGSQSGADAIADLPNSGASSPFHSNRDAARGIK
jgi:hypothetical protein